MTLEPEFLASDADLYSYSSMAQTSLLHDFFDPHFPQMQKLG